MEEYEMGLLITELMLLQARCERVATSLNRTVSGDTFPTMSSLDKPSQDGGVLAHKSIRHRSPTTSVNRTVDMDDSTQGNSLDDTGATGEADTSDLCYPSSFLSNGSSELKQDDETDGIDPKTNAILEHLGNKIVRVRDLIRTEQKLRDDNVNEYLKLAANADKQQVQRIKAVFEKKNQKSAQIISQLQKKTHGVAQSHRPPREVLRDMGQGLK
ncbi:hypothetical protein NQ318_023004 [Aromia moschata]|uniref:Uncharacterized protein n=1 Tax=Aromia moschata TaxID=1265417 RepID=A0AAV8YDT0_9CUCU|nr:hypothetical protein NQ318_023004 [Aromia moschata]